MTNPLLPLEDSALLAEIARALVTSPTHVRVEERLQDSKVVLLLYVLPEDRGRVIGRRGCIATAIRQLFSSIGNMDGRQVIVKIDKAD